MFSKRNCAFPGVYSGNAQYSIYVFTVSPVPAYRVIASLSPLVLPVPSCIITLQKVYGKSPCGFSETG